MRANQLGRTGIAVSELGLGTARLGGVFGANDLRTSTQLVQHALDQGMTFVDTANIYGHGVAEKAIGLAIAGRRDEVVVCTKTGFAPSGAKRAAPALKAVVGPLVRRLGVRRHIVPAALRGGVAHDFSRAALRQSVVLSLGRLGIPDVDVLLLHSPSPEALWQDETRDALDAIRKEGLARAVGVSLADDSVVEIPGEVQVVQAPVNVFTQPAFLDLLRDLANRGVGVIGRQCLASGKLAGTAAFDPSDPEAATLASIRAMSAEHGESVAETAFKAVHGRFGVACTLLGAHTLDHIDTSVEWLRRSSP